MTSRATGAEEGQGTGWGGRGWVGAARPANSQPAAETCTLRKLALKLYFCSLEKRSFDALFKPATHRPQFQERTAPGGERGEAVTH